MNRRLQNYVLYLTLLVSSIAALYLLIDAVRIGPEAQGFGARFAEGVLAVSFSLTVAVRRYVGGLDTTGLPSPTDIETLQGKSFIGKCAELLSDLIRRWESIMNSGLVYRFRKKVWKVVLVGSGVVGVTVSLVTGTGIAAGVGAASCVPGIIDAGAEVIGRSRNIWEFWERERDTLRNEWHQFQSDCL